MTQSIIDYCREHAYGRPTVERWLALSAQDGEALLLVARELKLGENHLRDFLDWLEEIALRDQVRLESILRGDVIARVLSDPRLGRSDKLKRVKEELRRLRYPRLAAIEEKIRKRIHALKLGSEIQMSFPPGLEGGQLTVQLRATSQGELKRLSQKLSETIETEPVAEIFDMLSGRKTNK